MSRDKFSEERLLNEIHEVLEVVGHVPTQTEFAEHASISTSPYYNRWDSWDEVLEEAGLASEERPSTRAKSDENLAEDIQRVANIVGRPPTTEQYDEHGQVRARTVARRFGSWTEALEAAGFQEYGTMEIPHKIGRETLLDKLEDLVDDLGKRPTRREINAHEEYPSSKAYVRMFGSWSNALEEAGIDDPEYPTGRDYDSWIPTSELFEELERICEDLGRGVTRREFNSLSEYSERPYIDRLGSWVEALEAAGFDPKPVEHPAGEDHPQYEGGYDSTRYGPGWNKSTKNKVRRRDDFTCQDPGCDMTQEQHQEVYGTALHVHHIEDPETFDNQEEAHTPENLITLCSVHHPKWEKLQPLVPDDL